MAVTDSEAAMLSVVRAAELDAVDDSDRWLIEDLWALGGLGVIGGSPKSLKSWIGLDMAISVATGTKALGRFQADHKGRALVYLAEDAVGQVRARIDALSRGRGLDIASLDLSVITEPSLRLDQDGDLHRLAATLDALRPRLLVLDPLVRLHRLDENSAADISDLLGALRDLQRRFDVAIVLVHHASKKSRAHPGQALRGSGDIHAVGDSYVYVVRQPKGLVLSVEQRAAKAVEPMRLELHVDELRGTARLRVSDLDDPGADRGSLDDDILDALADVDEPVTRAELRGRLRVNNQRLGDALADLERSAQVVRRRGGWTLRGDGRDEMPGETEAGSAGAQPAEG